MAHRAILIAGPTASGKSALGLKMAREVGGEIVNADSMQVYRELRVISARPSEEEERQVPHHLYGVLSVTEACSAGRWLDMLAPVLADIWKRGRTPILVGGTGLYFKAALEGLAPTPDIPDDTKAEARRILEEEGGEGLHASLSAIDPAMAARLNVGDPQRLVRAWEVKMATGRSLLDWQKQAAPSVLGEMDRAGEVRKIALLPDREWLYERINQRFEVMMEEGALEEAKTVAELGLGPEHPAMKALGIPSLIAYLHGQMSREEAISEAQMLSRRYAKRQMTWIRHQFSDWEHLSRNK